MPPVRSLLHRYVPAQLHDPVGLAMRLLRTGDPAALFAMATAAGGLAAAPLDMALALPERRLLAAADPTAQAPPLIFVCGAPRSGTTVAYQTLVNHLPVAYFSNLAALFPRAPLTAQRLFGRMAGQAPVDYHSFYGRTRGLAGPNDALFLWDRWLGADRTAAPAEPPSDRLDAMRRFFAACAGQFQRPLANKNNSLNLSAHWIAPALPQATFICMTRERRQLARSLYHARCEIHGSPQAAYGVAPREASPGADPVRSACRQATFYDAANRAQCERLGPGRFWMVSYEEFCREPAALVRRVAQDILAQPHAVRGPLPAAFRASASGRVPAEIGARIDAILNEAGDEPVEGPADASAA